MREKERYKFVYITVEFGNWEYFIVYESGDWGLVVGIMRFFLVRWNTIREKKTLRHKA